jgi:thioester reductase-like protein
MTETERLSPQEKRGLLAQLLQKRWAKYAPMIAPDHERNGLDRFGVTTADMRAEVVLDPSISFDAPLLEPANPPANIFLTGATGFLGAFILDEILRQTQAKVYCLVRCSSLEEGRQRISKTLETYLPANGLPTSRIIPVPGDLSKPLFGLSQSHFTELAGAVDSVFHNGAVVHGLYTYSQLKSANVQGTQEAMRLACVIARKPFHYVSTVAAVPLEDAFEVKVVRETQMDYDGTLYGGYTQSKWVAEQLVFKAGSRGLPVWVYRPGIITGHSLTGAWSTTDATSRMLKVAVESALLPDIEGAMDMTPVDYVSKAFVYLATSGRATSEIYHLANPRPVNGHDLVSWVRSYGYPLRRVPYEEWRAEMISLVGRSEKNPLSPFAPLFSAVVSDKIPPWMASKVASNYQSGVDRVIRAIGARYGAQSVQLKCDNALRDLEDASIFCPPVNERLLENYFSYFIRTGYLNSPVQ